jgi:tetratricopeptide (TPR) repeat protein
MKGLFQRRARSSSELGVTRLTLGAFGKHPGWDDHILLGVGAETETMAQAKETLYVAGIGGQVDSGAWEKLESDKRLAGFDHTFLWLRPRHTLLGQMWSSTDRKGRAKFPMVLCIDAEGVPPTFLLNRLFNDLEHLRGVCQATDSSKQVTAACRNGQEQLRTTLAKEPPKMGEPATSFESRRRFLEHGQLGPDRLGLLRALHELDLNAAVTSSVRGTSGSAARRLRSSHLRLPLASDSRTNALLLWVALLRCIVPEPVPLLLISRTGVDWLDVVINEPISSDFFCLQASPRALPLTTEIPYQLALDAKQRWQEFESRFLGPQSAFAATPPASVSPIVRLPSTEAPQATPPSSSPSRTAPASAAPAPKARPKMLFIGVGVMFIIIAAGVYCFILGSFPERLRLALRNPVPAVRPDDVQTAGEPASNQKESDRVYRTALATALEAQRSNDYSNAIAHAQTALKAKPGDPRASKLVDALQQTSLAAAQQEQQYEKATNGAAVALTQMNYREVTNQASIALAIKPTDPVATKQMADGQQGIVSRHRDEQLKYQAATNAAASALAQGKWQEATNQAGIALTLIPSDAAATKLMSDAFAAWQNEQRFETATNAAGIALAEGKYQEASREATKALGMFPNHPQALRLKAQADDGLALEAGQDYFERGEYAKAAEVCRLHASVDSFKTLASSVTAEQKVLDDASVSLAKGDYTFIEVLKAQSYSRKQSLSNLLAQAVRERASLEALRRLKETNARQELKNKLAEPEIARLLTKPPFAELRTWADTTPLATAETKDQTLLRLDTELEVLLVEFGVLKPTAREIHTDKARRTKPFPSGGLNDPQSFLDEVRHLQEEFQQGGWLDQNRRKYIEKLKDAINNR